MGTADDLDRAVRAARAQFDGGAWSQLKPLERERLIHRLADLIETHGDELAQIEAIDMGKSVVQARAVDIQARSTPCAISPVGPARFMAAPSSLRYQAITWHTPARKR